MNTLQIKNRLASIGQAIADLEEERRLVQDRLSADKWTEPVVRERILLAVRKRFGTSIKLIMFKVHSEYNDEYYTYSPLLILVDKDHNEVQHDISAQQFIPDENAQYEHYEKFGDNIEVNDITIRL